MLQTPTKRTNLAKNHGHTFSLHNHIVLKFAFDYRPMWSSRCLTPKVILRIYSKILHFEIHSKNRTQSPLRAYITFQHIVTPPRKIYTEIVWRFPNDVETILVSAKLCLHIYIYEFIFLSIEKHSTTNRLICSAYFDRNCYQVRLVGHTNSHNQSNARTMKYRSQSNAKAWRLGIAGD